jgi:hypothetical protein
VRRKLTSCDDNALALNLAEIRLDRAVHGTGILVLWDRHNETEMMGP